MKLFVTDAQLAALRLVAHHEVLATYAERFDAELARVRDDRARELDRLADPHAPFIADLREQVVWLRGQMEYERRRADQAVDQLLLWRAHVNAITPPLGGPARALTAEERALAEEMAQMGSVEGV